MALLGGAELLRDSDYGARRAYDRYPGNSQRGAPQLDSWGSALEALVEANPALLPFQLLGAAELFDQPAPTEPGFRRKPIRFVVGGESMRFLGMTHTTGAIRSKTHVLTPTPGDTYDGFSAYDEERSYGGGWFVVQFRQFNLPKFAVGFGYHRARNKPQATSEAQAFLAAMQES